MTTTRDMFVEENDDSPKPQETPKTEQVTNVGEVGNIVDLPSNGKLGYPGSVSYRDMLVGDEETLSLATEKTYVRTLNKVIKSVLNDCEFFEDMCVHDRDFLLVYLWANNYSPTKTVEMTCPHCGTKTDQTVDFTKLDITDINPKFKGYYEMPIEKLNGQKVKIRLNTVADEVAAENYIAANPDAKFDQLMLAQSIDINSGFGVDLKTKIKWVNDNIKATEMGKIKQFHIMLRYGVPTTIDYKCGNSSCGEVTKDAFPFQTEDILYPTVSTDIEMFL